MTQCRGVLEIRIAWNPGNKVRKYLKRSLTLFPEWCCNQPLERQLFTVLFWKRPLEIKIFIKPYFLLPLGLYWAKQKTTQAMSWEKWTAWASQVLVPARALLVYNPGVVSVCFGRGGGVPLHCCWVLRICFSNSLTDDLVPEYRFVTEELFSCYKRCHDMRRCKKSIPLQ